MSNSWIQLLFDFFCVLASNIRMLLINSYYFFEIHWVPFFWLLHKRKRDWRSRGIAWISHSLAWSTPDFATHPLSTTNDSQYESLIEFEFKHEQLELRYSFAVRVYMFQRYKYNSNKQKRKRRNKKHTDVCIYDWRSTSIQHVLWIQHEMRIR